MDPLLMQQFWGYSPALDFRVLGGLLEGKGKKQEQEQEQLLVLQAGAGDCRHLLTTLCMTARHQPSNQHDDRLAISQRVVVYTHEDDVATLARQLLLISVATDTSLHARERVELFLELHGNCMLRDSTAAYLEDQAQLLAEVVLQAHSIDEQGSKAIERMAVVQKLFDLSQLKYRERDDLVDTLRSWKRNVLCDMSAMREWRLRKHYGDRYDARRNLVDWDYHMRLQSVASIVHFKQYREWRELGIAYEVRESTYTVANRSLVSHAEGRTMEHKDRVGREHGRSVLKRGFWGDIINCPYLAFGIEAEDKDLFKLSNNQHVKTAVDVAEYNLTALLHALKSGSVYQHNESKAPKEFAHEETINNDDACTSHDTASSSQYEQTVPSLADTGNQTEQHAHQVVPDSDFNENAVMRQSSNEESSCCGFDSPEASAAVSSMHCILTCGDVGKTLLTKAKLNGRFHLVVLGYRDIHWVQKGLEKVAAPGAVLVLEGPKYLTELKKEQADEARSKLVSLVQSFGWRQVAQNAGLDDAHIVLTLAN
eukprot:jgi/Chlat1/2696/Chrsp180S02869